MRQSIQRSRWLGPLLSALLCALSPGTGWSDVTPYNPVSYTHLTLLTSDLV